ncbi:CAP-associated domain-containing protein [Enterococcus sp. CSURQ0835]|uniref:CAP-associated domain-containing protein n=1 Tax=Enterococcus sp. CSURQ0835 TaxID=2681394 RepID=UPI001358B758|nr:CAP-associated domain-containing protein [Enterococcus sp. CSURQ0835]
MKRAIGFISIFLCVLIGYYIQPILFPPATPTVKKIPEQPLRHHALKYEQIPATGFAPFIGQSVAQFEQTFGLAEKSEPSGFFFETRFYSLATGRLAVNSEEGVVVGINVVAKSEPKVAPFTFGMTNEQLFANMNLSANFGVTYDEEPVAIVLSEDDMRARPLIAFNNQSFAILFFDAQTKKLAAITYLDLEMLLRLMPYQINSGNPLSYRMQDTSQDWQQIDQTTQVHLTELIDAYRQTKRLPKNQQTAGAETASHQLLQNFLQQPAAVLSKSRLEEWQMDQTAHLVNDDFYLTPAEFKKLAQTEKIKYQAGFFYSPVIDPFFSFYYWCSEPAQVALFNGRAENLAVAVDQQNVLVLKQEFEETKGSDRP